MNQTTIKRPVSISGIGLHSGNKVSVSLHPAVANTGILFEIHTPEKIQYLKPVPSAVLTTELATTLGCNGAAVSTVEHLLAAILAMQIDNIVVSVTGGEIPILDGSADTFRKHFLKAGIRSLPASRKFMRVNRPVESHNGQRSIIARPFDGFYVSYTIEFPHPVIGCQHFSLLVTPENFAQVANARTFGFFKDVEFLHSHGLARGGSLESVIVLDEKGVMNPEGLRYKDEFVRHKLLDFIGDMAMLGTPVQGHFEVRCSGHEFNNKFLRMLEAEQALTLVDTAISAKNEKKERNLRYNGSLALA